MNYTYLSTFHTHFDAISFFHQAKILGEARMKPVPRAISSSCGTCVVVTVSSLLSPVTYAEWPVARLFLQEDEGYRLLMECE